MAWKHCPYYWPFVWEIHQSPVDSPYRGLVMWTLYASFNVNLNLVCKHIDPNNFKCYVFSCDQAALRTLLSVRLSVRLSVTPVSLCSCHRIIMKWVVTIDKSDVHAKGQGQKSKVKVTEVKTQQSLMLLRKGTLLFFKVIRPISKSQG